MTRFCLSVAALAAVLPVGACTSGGDRAPSTFRTVTDTIGDTIVVRTARSSAEQPVRRLVEELRIGRLDGPDEYVFGSIDDVAVGPHGEIYVLDVQSKVIRQYDSTGAFVRTMGQAGRGPGDFNAANGIGVLPGGRVVLWESSQHRLNVYGADGRPAATWAIHGTNPNNVYQTRYAVTTDTLGHTLLRTGGGYLRFDSTGRLRDTVSPPKWDVPSGMLTATKETEIDGGRSSMSSSRLIPFFPTVLHQWSPLGYLVAARTDTFAIHALRPSMPVRIEREATRIPVEPERATEARDELTADLRKVDPKWDWNGPPVPSVYPYLNWMEVGNDGRIWVAPALKLTKQTVTDSSARGRPPVTRTRWTGQSVYEVFEPDGRYLGAVEGHRAFIRARRGNHVWGFMNDSLDVPLAVRFRVEPPFR